MGTKNIDKTIFLKVKISLYLRCTRTKKQKLGLQELLSTLSLMRREGFDSIGGFLSCFNEYHGQESEITHLLMLRMWNTTVNAPLDSGGYPAYTSSQNSIH